MANGDGNITIDVTANSAGLDQLRVQFQKAAETVGLSAQSTAKNFELLSSFMQKFNMTATEAATSLQHYYGTTTAGGDVFRQFKDQLHGTGEQIGRTTNRMIGGFRAALLLRSGFREALNILPIFTDGSSEAAAMLNKLSMTASDSAWIFMGLRPMIQNLGGDIGALATPITGAVVAGGAFLAFLGDTASTLGKDNDELDKMEVKFQNMIDALNGIPTNKFADMDIQIRKMKDDATSWASTLLSAFQLMINPYAITTQSITEAKIGAATSKEGILKAHQKLITDQVGSLLGGGSLNKSQNISDLKEIQSEFTKAYDAIMNPSASQIANFERVKKMLGDWIDRLQGGEKGAKEAEKAQKAKQSKDSVIKIPSEAQIKAAFREVDTENARSSRKAASEWEKALRGLDRTVQQGETNYFKMREDQITTLPGEIERVKQLHDLTLQRISLEKDEDLRHAEANKENYDYQLKLQQAENARVRQSGTYAERMNLWAQDNAGQGNWTQSFASFTGNELSSSIDRVSNALANATFHAHTLRQAFQEMGQAIIMELETMIIKTLLWDAVLALVNSATGGAASALGSIASVAGASPASGASAAISQVNQFAAGSSSHSITMQPAVSVHPIVSNEGLAVQVAVGQQSLNKSMMK